jgi:DNA/RNA-binding domain of Phe-tRNA-synthetase-like protein
MSGAPSVDPVAGWCSREVQEELPGLRLLSVGAHVRRRGGLRDAPPPDVEARMRELSSRFRGARAISLRREPVPAAYRVFYRHIGLDPDVERTPIEAAVLERMLRGGFLSGGVLEDILLIALLDTGVPVWALASDAVEGPLGVRTSGDGEILGGPAGDVVLPAGRLVVADSVKALAVLFGARAASCAPTARARQLTLFAVQVAGVPALYAEETLWSARAALEVP